MSSPSRSRPSSTASAKVDLVIIGSGWPAWWAAHRALAATPSVALIETPVYEAPALEVIHVGTGERRARAALSFGEAVTESLWNLSQENYRRAEALFAELSVPFQPSSVHWEKEKEPGLLVDSGKLTAALKASAPPALRHYPVADLPRLTAGSVGDHRLTLPDGAELRFSFAVALEARFLLTLDREMKEVLIPVTLSVFEEAKAPEVEPGFYLFHQGADFALNADTLQFGSYRNLYEDKAVGFHTAYDPVSHRFGREFFRQLGWVKGEVTHPKFRQRYYTLSCDGLPVIGTLRGSEGVFTAAGFASRPQNYLFAVIDQLLQEVSSPQATRFPVGFSSKRFV